MKDCPKQNAKTICHGTHHTGVMPTVIFVRPKGKPKEMTEESIANSSQPIEDDQLKAFSIKLEKAIGILKPKKGKPTPQFHSFVPLSFANSIQIFEEDRKLFLLYKISSFPASYAENRLFDLILRSTSISGVDFVFEAFACQEMKEQQQFAFTVPAYERPIGRIDDEGSQQSCLFSTPSQVKDFHLSLPLFLS